MVVLDVIINNFINSFTHPEMLKVDYYHNNEKIKYIVKEASKDAELVNVRRYFHTLKGSGRMVGAKSSGELAWTVEDTLNRVIANNLELNTEIQQYVSTVFNIYKFLFFFGNTR